MKKIIVFSIMVAMFLALVSCNNGTTSQTKKVVQLTGTVNIWTSAEDEAMLSEGAAEFNKLNPKVKINIKTMDTNSEASALTSAIQNKSDLPDIITMNTYNCGHFIDKFQNYLLDVSSISGFKSDSFVKSSINNGYINNKYYAIPWYVSPTYVVYREDLLGSYGIKAEDIKTWDDIVDLEGSKIKQTGKGIFPLSYFKSGTYYLDAYNELAINYFDKNNKATLLNDDSMKVYNTINNMYFNNVFYDDSKDGNEINSFVKGDTLGLVCDLKTLKDIESKYENLKGKLDVEKLPGFEPGGNRDVIGSGSNILTLKGSSNNKAAIVFMKYLSMNSKYALTEFNNFGRLSAYNNLYKEQSYFSTDGYYGNKSLGRIAIDEANGARDVEYPKKFQFIETSIANAITDCALNKKSLSDSITAIQNNLNTATSN